MIFKMKKLTLFAMACMAISLFSCSESEIPEPVVSNDTRQTRGGNDDIASVEGPVLSFESMEDFKSAVAELEQFSSEEEKFKFMTSFYPGFKSIQHLFWEAMEEMEEMDDVDEDQYNAFMQKYKGLYFPLYQEDAGFYIPMTNLDEAFFVNRGCKVEIAGEIKDLRDIRNYQQLINFNRAYYPKDMAALSSSYTTFQLNSTSMRSVGPEYDSGWTKYNKRKVKLKARRRFKTFYPTPLIKGSKSLFHLEFCFRKKTCFGWCNYKSRSTIRFKANIPGKGWTNEYVFNHNGYSSHDSELEYPIKITNDATHTYYTFGEAPCIANIDYRGVDHTLNYSWTMPGCYCSNPRTEHPVLILPSY